MYNLRNSNLKKTVTFIAAGLSVLSFLLLTTCGGQRIGGVTQTESYKDYARAEKKSAMMDMPAGAVSRDMEEVDDDGAAVRHNTEEYDLIKENEFKGVKDNPLSTFSIDVDTASYTNVRRYLNGSQLPPKDAVRIEEMINYFKYSYPQPEGEHPFTISTEISEAPWNSENRLLLIGIQGKSLNYNDLKPCNFVFLIDSSGSMADDLKLPLLKKSLALMLKGLNQNDRIAIVAYAGSAGVVLPSTPATQKDKILGAFDTLTAGGSTAGGEGIMLAYKIAKENLIKDGNNRVILCTDGDFNVGASSTSDMVRMIEEKRKDDIYLTICGFGMGNYKDGRMEQISNAGNGNYFYIDSIKESEKVFVRELRANMFTIAKDVKIQIEFNPLKVKSYRLIGYENRVMAKEDFDNDKKDAGELGAGHTVTALYEIVPAGPDKGEDNSIKLRYQESKIKKDAASGSEIMVLKMRYKPIKEDKSKLIEKTVLDEKIKFAKTSENFRFASAVAGFGMLLRDSQFKNDLTAKDVIKIAKEAKGYDEEGYRSEFIGLVEKYSLLK
jgi:Ca-activated chloride channel family protein